jgi:UDP-N-acetylmuramyl pentapeptide phosphotransferase/UDP-N-acetylglucosamine-1-phosphate transferase
MQSTRVQTAISSAQIPHVVCGVIALTLGLYGIYDEYFAVVEFIKGFIQPLLSVIGLVMIMAGLLTYKPKLPHVAIGLVLLGIGIYGFFDEYYATLDFFKGAIPPILLLFGMVSVVAGIKKLES